MNLTDNTLEFRIFRGTLKWETILASIEFCDAVISYCGQYGASAMNATRFREWLNTGVTRKTYPALRDYLVTRKVFAAPKPAPLASSPETLVVTSSHSEEPMPRRIFRVWPETSWSHLYVVTPTPVQVYNTASERSHVLNPAYRDSVTCNGCVSDHGLVPYVTAVCTVEDVPVGALFTQASQHYPDDPEVWTAYMTRTESLDPLTI